MNHAGKFFESARPWRAWLIAIAGMAAVGVILVLPPLAGWVTLELDYGNLLSAAGLLFTIVILLVSVVPGVSSIAATARSAHYAQLDTTYQDLLKMAVEKPYLRRPDELDPDRQQEYEVYAFIVWNFLETVRDRCDGDNTLQIIWGPVIAAENAIHKTWFLREAVPYLEIREPKFRLEFADFIWCRLWMQPDDASGNAELASDSWISKSWECRDREAIRSDPRVRRFLQKAV